MGAGERAASGAVVRTQVLWTLLGVVLFRLGQDVPVPYVNVRALSAAAEAGRADQLHWLLDLLTGGGAFRLSFFAFGVLPVLLGGLVLRLLIDTVPRFAAVKAAGAAGVRRMRVPQRWLTAGIGLVLGVLLVAATAGRLLPSSGPRGGDVLTASGFLPFLVTVCCMAAGAGAVLLLAELITARGVGDGVGILLLAQITSVVAGDLGRVYQSDGLGGIATVLVVALLLVAATILIAQAQRRLPLQYSERMVGRTSGAAPNYLPLRMNQSGGSALFASVLLYFPVLVGELWPDVSWLRGIRAVFQDEGNPWRLAVYFGLIWFGSAAAAAGRYHPDELAAKLSRQGGFVPGVRPGRPTAELIGWVTNRIVFAGGFAVAVLAVIPPIGLGLLDAAPRFPFGGVTVLFLLYFTVHVTLDTVRRVDDRRLSVAYRPFLP